MQFVFPKPLLPLPEPPPFPPVLLLLLTFRGYPRDLSLYFGRNHDAVLDEKIVLMHRTNHVASYGSPNNRRTDKLRGGIEEGDISESGQKHPEIEDGGCYRHMLESDAYKDTRAYTDLCM